MKKLIVVLIALLVLPSAALSAESYEGYVQKSINSISTNTETHYSTHDELMSVINGKTTIGESVKSKKGNNYFNETFNTDGTVSMKVFKKGSGQLVKTIFNRKWSINDDGYLCYEKKGKIKCQHKVTQIEGLYLTVNQTKEKEGKVWKSWEIK